MLSALVHWLYVTRVGGDFMHGRLLLPTLLGFLLPVATVVIPLERLRRWRAAVLVGVGAWAVVCAVSLRVSYEDVGAPGPWGIADERGFYTYHMNTPNPVYLADYLRHPYVAEFQSRLLSFRRAILFN